LITISKYWPRHGEGGDCPEERGRDLFFNFCGKGCGGKKKFPRLRRMKLPGEKSWRGKRRMREDENLDDY
jgi:hypothetical protein